jgi:hypothetical protein
MKYVLPFKFWQLLPDGQRAYQAYEHIHSYHQGVTVQYSRIYDIWTASSNITGNQAAPEVLRQKQALMKQVVRDIHCLLIFLQVIWKTLKVLSNKELYPHFELLSALQGKWEPYFEQYREPRNTLEHYDDQVLGADSKNNGPGWGLSLSAHKGFSLGAQTKVSVDQQAYETLCEFMAEFEAAIEKIVEPGTGNAVPGCGTKDEVVQRVQHGLGC